VQTNLYEDKGKSCLGPQNRIPLAKLRRVKPICEIENFFAPEVDFYLYLQRISKDERLSYNPANHVVVFIAPDGLEIGIHDVEEWQHVLNVVLVLAMPTIRLYLMSRSTRE